MCGVLELQWCCGQWADELFSRHSAGHLRVFLCALSSLCHRNVCLLSAPLLVWIILLCERTGPNLAWCFGLDELVAQWNKPVCLLHKPMFQAYTLWRLYTALLKKKEVISAAVWIRSWWRGILLALLRAGWPGFWKAFRARDISRIGHCVKSVHVICPSSH